MFTIQLDQDDLMLLGRLLPEHPYKAVAPLIHKINAQVQVQVQAQQQPVAAQQQEASRGPVTSE